jgi:hypothetical protein
VGQGNPSHTPTQEEQKFYVESAEAPFEEAALPEFYGDNRLVILPRDPYWFFAYWEITADRWNSVRQQVGADLVDSAQQVLRVYDISGMEFNGDQGPVKARRYFDVTIQIDSRNWYVNVDQPGCTYLVEMGLKLADGRFIALLRSNRIRLPSGRVSDQTDSEWMAVHHLYWDKLMELSGARRIGKGSAEIAQVMAQRWEFLKAVFSASFSFKMMPSSMPSSFGSHTLARRSPEKKP